MNHIKINSLRLKNFRNYENLDCSFNEHINVITGLNGVGKTSILDAIYYLSNGKSYFTHLDSHIYRKGDSHFNISSHIVSGIEKYQLTILSSSEKGKQIILDDTTLNTLAEYVGKFPAFMIAPKDILILVESSAERRKLIDRTISQVDRMYLNHLIHYNKLLKLRNAALKSFLKKGRQDLLMLEAIDKKMIEPAHYICVKRKSYVGSIGPIIGQQYLEICSQKESINIKYKSKLIDKDFNVLLAESRAKDLIIGKTHEGIHRDDLAIYLDDLDIRKIGSQGQLKSAIIAIKLAQVDWIKQNGDVTPIILLDDIFDKLDRSRVEKLIDICATNLGAQIFITDTEADRVTESLQRLNLDFNHFEIDNAKIVEDGR